MNSPIPSLLLPLWQNKSLCENIGMKICHLYGHLWRCHHQLTHEAQQDSSYVLRLNIKRASVTYDFMCNIIDEVDQAELATFPVKGQYPSEKIEHKSKNSDTNSDEDVPLEDLFQKPVKEVEHAAPAVEDNPKNQLDY